MMIDYIIAWILIVVVSLLLVVLFFISLFTVIWFMFSDIITHELKVRKARKKTSD